MWCTSKRPAKPRWCPAPQRKQQQGAAALQSTRDCWTTGNTPLPPRLLNHRFLSVSLARRCRGLGLASRVFLTEEEERSPLLLSRVPSFPHRKPINKPKQQTNGGGAAHPTNTPSTTDQLKSKAHCARARPQRTHGTQEKERTPTPPTRAECR